MDPVVEFEEICKRRFCDIVFRRETDSLQFLASLSKKYSLNIALSFEELLENFDRKYFTPRCILYHPLDKCLPYYFMQGDILYARICYDKLNNKENFKLWNNCLHAVCEKQRYWMVPNLFNMIPDSLQKKMKREVFDICLQSKDRKMIDCFSAHLILDVKKIFVESCANNDLQSLNSCLRLKPVLHKEGLYEAIIKNHIEVVRYLLTMGLDITNNAFKLAIKYQRSDIYNILARKKNNLSISL